MIAITDDARSLRPHESGTPQTIDDPFDRRNQTDSRQPVQSVPVENIRCQHCKRSP